MCLTYFFSHGGYLFRLCHEVNLITLRVVLNVYMYCAAHALILKIEVFKRRSLVQRHGHRPCPAYEAW